MSWLADHTVHHLRRVVAWPEFTGDRYTLVRELGRGGMGTVYLARDHVLGREVALKVANTAGAKTELEARMRTEALVLARLEHPGIVPIHDVGTLADGRLFYVMKLVRGRSLEEHLRLVPNLPDRLRLFERLAEPVAFAHAHGVVHRDLKPSNVMVGSFGEVLVMDWGVAKVLGEPNRLAPEPSMPDGNATASASAGHAPGGATGVGVDGDHGARHTEPGTVLGTRGFMSPEQAAGRTPLIDQRTDVYALGAILYWMLAGALPRDAARADLASLAGRLSHVPRRLRAVCRRATAVEPADRYPGAGDLADDVARFLAGQPVRAHHETPWERAARVTGTYRVPILLVVAYLVMRALVAWLAA